MNNDLINMLKVDEGLRLDLYEDTVGKLTIGWGRNIDDNGISEIEAEFMLENDINIVINELKQYGWATDHDNVRSHVIIDMAFNMGVPKLLGFKKMIAALELKDYRTASEEMLDSKWANQVGVRSDRLHYMMSTGDVHPDYEVSHEV